jgi:hypothetical protein
MTDAYREDWDITSEEGSLCFASAIYSRLVGGEQDEATLQWLAKYLRANAPPRNHTAMNDQHYDLMPAQFNLNDDVKVKLTDHGRDLLAKKRRLTRQPDEAGYTKFQLWELMNIFGEHFYNGCSIPFEFNRILLAPFNPAMNDQLRTRVEALEARNETQRQATLEWGKDVDNHSRWIDDHLKRIMALEEGQKPSLSTSLHSYSVGEAKPPEDCGKVKVLPDLSQRIIGSLEWTQQEQEQELDSVFADRQIVAVPAHRGGQSIRFKVFADDPGLSDYGSGKLLALSKVVFKVLSNNMLESGIIEVTAISVGLVADMLDQQAEYAAQQMDQAAPSPSPAPTDSLVERVARRLARFACEGLPGDDATPIASAVLCDVAAWILEQAPAPGPPPTRWWRGFALRRASTTRPTPAPRSVR